MSHHDLGKIRDFTISRWIHLLDSLNATNQVTTCQIRASRVSSPPFDEKTIPVVDLFEFMLISMLQVM
jgi:hypothetical protein